MERAGGFGSLALLSQFARRLRRSTLAANTFWLYCIAFSNYLLPLATIPYLARVLGPAVLGVVVSSQSLAAWLTLAVEYGFSFTATREIACARNDKDKLAQIAGAIMVLQLLIAVAASLIAVGVAAVVPIFRGRSVCVLAAWFLGVFQGLNPFWYFQGIERLRTATLVNALSRAVGYGSMLLLVHTPAHASRVLLLQAGSAGFACLVNMFMVRRELELRQPLFSDLRRTASRGLAVFLSNSAASLYSVFGILLLATLVSPYTVGVYGGAERIHRAVLSLFTPICQALYPRVSLLASSDVSLAAHTARRAMALMLSLGIALALGVIFLAPVLVSYGLGPKYEAAKGILRILAFQYPITALSRVLGTQWLLPLRHDRAFLTVVVTAGLTNVLLILSLVPRFGASGMAASFVTTELLVLAGLAAVVSMKTPLWRLKHA